MQDVGRRRDRVGAVEEGPASKPGCRQEAECCRLVAGDVAIHPGFEVGGRNDVALVEDLGRLTKGVAGLERALVGLRDHGSGRELLIDPAQGRIHAPLVQPEHDPEGEEVLRQVDLLVRHFEPFEGPGVERRDRDLEDGVLLERTVGQGTAGVGRLVQVLLRERVTVYDQRAARWQIADIGLEGGRIHRHEDVGLVTGRVDLTRGEADLEAGHAGQAAGRRADFRWEVGQGADVVAKNGSRASELRPGQLHPVAGVAGETDGDPVQLLLVELPLPDLGGHAPSDSCIC